MSDDKEIIKAYQTPTMEMSDSKLLEIADAWLTESKKYHNKLKKIWDQNEKYYLGNQTDLDKIPSDKANSVQNHIFMGVETVVPIITANPPQFIVEPPEESDQSAKYAQSIQSVLGVQYTTIDVRSKGEMLVRHMILFRLGCWKVFWDEDTDDVNIKWVRPQRLYFPEVSGKIPYMIEKLDVTSEEFRDLWGDEKFAEFLKSAGQEVENDDIESVKGSWTIWEIWNRDMVFWKYGSMIIDKLKNPNYNFEDKKKNHFKTPKIPYIMASAFRLGNGPVGDTDLIQQTIPIQDDINATKRIIINNSKKMGNGTWLIDSDVMSEEEARTKITNSEGLIIYGQGVANPNLLRRDAPPPLPQYIDNLRIESEQAFDNIFGTHSTTRGERGAPETATGRMVLKNSDLGRIDLLVREFERVVEELGNWLVQMMKINYETKKTFRSYGENGVTFITLEPHMIETGIKVVIKSGTTLPTDEVSKRNDAKELWSLGGLDPVTLYERMKFPNPEETAKRLQLWKQNQLDMEVKANGQAQPGAQRGVGPMGNPLGIQGALQNKMTGGTKS